MVIRPRQATYEHAPPLTSNHEVRDPSTVTVSCPSPFYLHLQFSRKKNPADSIVDFPLLTWITGLNTRTQGHCTIISSGTAGFGTRGYSGGVNPYIPGKTPCNSVSWIG